MKIAIIVTIVVMSSPLCGMGTGAGGRTIYKVKRSIMEDEDKKKAAHEERQIQRANADPAAIRAAVAAQSASPGAGAQGAGAAPGVILSFMRHEHQDRTTHVFEGLSLEEIPLTQQEVDILMEVDTPRLVQEVEEAGAPEVTALAAQAPQAAPGVSLPEAKR